MGVKRHVLMLVYCLSSSRVLATRGVVFPFKDQLRRDTVRSRSVRLLRTFVSSIHYEMQSVLMCGRYTSHLL